MRPLPLTLFIAASLAFAVSPTPSHGKDRKAEERRAKQEARQAALSALQRGEILPLTRIMQIATSRVPGDIIEIEYKAGPKYEVKILTPAGRVRELKLDARTGDIITIEDK